MKDKHIANVAHDYICYILIEGSSILHKNTLQKFCDIFKAMPALSTEIPSFFLQCNVIQSPSRCLTPAGEETGHSESHLIPGFKEQRGGRC